MGRAEGPLGDDALFAQNARDGVDLGDLQRLVEGKVGHDGGDAAGDHRLARAGRADQKKVMPARDGDLHRAPRHRLTLDELEIGGTSTAHPRNVFDGPHGLGMIRSDEEADGLGERPEGIAADAVQKARFPRILGGDHKGREPARLGGNEDGQKTTDGAQAAVEGELAQKHDALEIGPHELFARLQKADGNGKIEGGALLPEIGGSKVDRHLDDGEGEPAVLECGAHALLGFLDGGIGQTHHLKGGHALVDVRLHRDGHPFEPRQRKTRHIRDHTFPLLFCFFPQSLAGAVFSDDRPQAKRSLHQKRSSRNKTRTKRRARSVL